MRKTIAKAAALAGTFAVATGLVIAAQSTFGIGAIPPRTAPDPTVTVALPPVEPEPLTTALAPAATAVAAAPVAATLGNIDVSVVQKPKNAKSDKAKARAQKKDRLPTQSASRP
ncbi:MAG: hypothetical protein FJX54_15040 [Alphaproteobacteria bacterium]|nr:hypothetical protein [Alphaproteobacteria bacterium]